MKKLLMSVVRGEEGASLVEYGLLVALIAAVCIAILTTLGLGIQGKFSDISTAIGGGGGGT
jgi:pilus assembly protein Flp/PilA